MTDTAQGLIGELQYNTNLFEVTTIRRLAGHFQTLLEGIVANPKQRLSALPLLSAAERQQVLLDWNATRVDFPQEQCIHQLFEAQVQQRPEAVAVAWGDRHLTYQQLNEQANQLAHYLRRLGVGPETLVGLCLERSLEMVVGLLGILKAGGAYVPLDPDYPQERLTFMVEDAQLPLLLTQQRLVAQLPTQRTSLVCLDADGAAIAQESRRTPLCRTTADNAAYVIYTSGSTGRPKGVIIPHRALMNHSRAIMNYYGLQSDDRILQFASLSFDVAAEELFPSWLSGAAVVLRPAALSTSLAQFLDVLEKERLTVLNLPTAYWSAWTSELARSAVELPAWLRLVIVGGEKVSGEAFATWQQRVGARIRWSNAYGPTEATITATAYDPLIEEDQPDEAGVPIGRPIANMQVYLLDAQLHPVPIGVPGELYIGGVGLARGYLNHPELTAERFIADPFSPRPGARLYKTGDQARYLPNGSIEFLGRRDHQVKLRGYRIELGEIEAILSQHPGVRECLVLIREEAMADKQLVAYVLPEQAEQEPSQGELRNFLQGKLPQYMVPSAFVLMEAWPLTPNGKIDQRALPAPERTRSAGSSSSLAPRSPVEEVLVGIWAHVLGVEQVDVHDNFFELGGHSLLAMQVIWWVRQTLQIELPVSSLFETPTVAQLAPRLETFSQTPAGMQLPPLEPRLRPEVLPLSFAQQRLWFLDQWEPDSPLYNIPLAWHLRGPLQVSVLEQSLNEILRRHEALRTRFVLREGQPMQVIAPVGSLQLPVTDLSGLPQAQREAHVRRLITEEAQRPFALRVAPLLRVQVVRLAPQEHVLLLTMHHIVSDEWSVQVLLRELSTLYTAYAAGQPSPLPDLPLQYADFALWQRQWLQGEVLAGELAYWKERLAGAPALLNLPSDHPRPAMQSFRGATHSFALPQPLSQALKKLSQREGVSLFMTLLAAFQTLLLRYTGQSDLVIGTPIANRSRPELAGLIGFFVNTLALRTDLSGDPSFSEVLRRVRQVALEAYAHQDVPFEQVVEALQPQRDPSRNPLFQVMFVLEHAPMDALGPSDLALQPLPVESATAKFDVSLLLSQVPQGLLAELEYNTDLFEASTIRRLAGHFQTLLEGIVANPKQRLSELPLLSAAERQQLLLDWNATRVELPQETCIHQLFEAQVHRTPEALALLYEDQQLSYQQLNQQANQLAHYLRKQGVGPEVRVGLCLKRSLEMVVGLFAILKAGGAYVPLDPAYPQERLAFMLQDSQMSLLLTQQSLLEDLPAHQAKVVCLDTGGQALAQESQENLANSVTADNLAYVIYTSGSTGRPKGAMILHRGLLNYLSWCSGAYEVAVGKGSPLHSPLGFDLTVTSLFSPLLVGQPVVLVPEDQGAEALPEALRSGANFSLVKLTPSHVQLLTQSLLPQEAAGSARALVIGGEALLAEQLAFWRTHAPQTRLINEYGPTETVVGCCVYEVAPDDPASGPVSIGRPIANTQLYILDGHLQPLPVGVPGELYIGGVGLARGYLNRPELTAERFLPHPCSTEPGARLYKTGDLARYRSDGNIEFLGRRDEQVKLRGYRIELGEIEAVLNQHPAVGESLVLLREDVPGDKRLVAYLLAEQAEQRLPLSELRSYLKAKLPEYMVPSAFVTLEALPLTPNGKVDRRTLPAPDHTRPELEKAFVAPRTPAEELLAGIWAQVLGIEQVGIYDNFFELGGDSILSIQIITRANQAGLRFTPKQIFQHQTIAELAAVADISPAIQAEQALVTGPVPLTPIQHWFFEQRLAEPHHWNQAFLFEVQQALHPSLLEQVIQRLLVHHDALRLRFVQEESNWRQVNVGPDGPVPFKLIDLSSLSEAEQGPAIEAMAAQLQASLNLSEGPLLRVALFNLGTQQSSRLLIIIHHLAVDMVSWWILLEDLQTAYQQLRGGGVIQLPSKTTSFKHWAQRLTEHVQSGTLKRELAYWLAEPRTPVSCLPVDYPEGRGANTIASVGTISVSLSVEETRALLQEIPAAYHTHINDALLTAMVQAFEQWTGTSSLLIDLEGHGREAIFEDVDLSRTVGWFTTIFPVLLDLEETSNPGDALKSVKEQLRRIPNRGIGYGLLRYLLGDTEIAEKLRGLPQAEVTFNYLGQFDQALPEPSLFKLAGESSGLTQSPQGSRRHLLEVNGVVLNGQLQLDWSYSKNLHRRATVEGLAEGFVKALRLLITHCRAPEVEEYTPSDFPFARLDEEKLSQLSILINKVDNFEESAT